VALSGCSDPSSIKYCELNSQTGVIESPVQISAVLAPTQNFVNFKSIIDAANPSVSDALGGNLSDEAIKEALGRELSVVLADGTAQLAVKRAVTAKGEDVYDIEKAIELTFKSFQLVAECSGGKLKRPTDGIDTQSESDLLGGLEIAAAQLTAPSSKKIIYVLGNGLQTTGAIRMQDPGKLPQSERQADQLVEQLKSIGQLPDLNGATVYWFGLGQVDGEFQKLDLKSRDSLVYFWQRVIEESNGTLSEENTQTQVGTGLPHKNAVDVSHINVVPCELVVKLYEKDGVKFEPDSNVFVDGEKAKSAAKSVVAAFDKANCKEMTVHGYAAAGVDKSTYESKKSEIDETNKALTLLRAKAFAKLLLNAGFKGLIKTTGEGTCGTEWKANGKVDSSEQLLCRRVEVSN
jgi:hypothetical protein